MVRATAIKMNISARKQAEDLIKESKMLLSAEKLVNKIAVSEVKQNIEESRKLFRLAKIAGKIDKGMKSIPKRV